MSGVDPSQVLSGFFFILALIGFLFISFLRESSLKKRKSQPHEPLQKNPNIDFNMDEEVESDLYLKQPPLPPVFVQMDKQQDFQASSLQSLDSDVHFQQTVKQPSVQTFMKKLPSKKSLILAHEILSPPVGLRKRI